ncbi:MAG: flagellar hook-associated protein FlgK [Oscillospiraceae bacterium]|jgi:flagellar hook-associated protein 1 FlgK|nr:flagellar hook-associated protein FlgK [Oscillospiraceae bacterium]
MRATFYGFEAVRKALMTSQTALDVTSQNVSNVNTEGYTRQRVDISSLAISAGSSKFAPTRGSEVGQGADVSGISQIRDQFLDLRFRKQYSEYGKWDSKLAVLSDVDNVFDEVETNGLSVRFADFFKQLQGFSTNSESIESATVFRSSAQKIVEVFNQYSSMLSGIKDEHIYNLQTEIKDVNDTIQKVAQLNIQIKGQLVQGTAPNELLDARNLLLDKLSYLAGATFEFKDNGEVSVKIGDNYLLDSEKSNYINKLALETSGYPVSVKFTNGSSATVDKGTISGYLEGLNGKGTFGDATNPSDDTNKGIMFFQMSIDALAKSFAESFNQVNDSTGVKKLFAGDASGNITASSISLSQDWLKDAQFITKTTDTTGTGSGKNDNLLRMINLMNTKQNITPYFTGTFEEHIVSIMGDMAVEVDYTQDMKESSETVLNTIHNQRESISGVSLDEEGVNMIKYQKSYNAAARIMTVMDEMMDILINKLGIVGR